MIARCRLGTASLLLLGGGGLVLVAPSSATTTATATATSVAAMLVVAVVVVVVAFGAGANAPVPIPLVPPGPVLACWGAEDLVDAARVAVGVGCQSSRVISSRMRSSWASRKEGRVDCVEEARLGEQSAH